MSADNGIYILGTTETIPIIDVRGYQTVSEQVKSYRPAHVQAIDNLDYCEKQNPALLSIYLLETWGDARCYRSGDAALAQAQIMADDLGYVEYGISMIERFDWNTDFFYEYNLVRKSTHE